MSDWNPLEIFRAAKAKREASGVALNVPVKSKVLDDAEYYNVSELLLSTPKDLLVGLLLPLFALDKRDKQDFDITTDDGKFSVKITSNPLYGRATMYDKEYLLYAYGIVQKMIDNKIITRDASNRTLCIDAKQMLIDIKSENTELYDKTDAWNKLDQAGNRLMTTLIQIYVDYGRKKRSVEKSLFITSFKLEQEDDKIMLKMKLSDWVWKSIMAHKPADILSLESVYWDMTPFQRRIYELFLVNMGLKNHAGNKAHDVAAWKYTDLRKLCGKRTDRNFKTDLKALFTFDLDKEACDKEFRKTKMRRGIPDVWGHFHCWAVAMYPDKLVIIRKDLLKIPHKK